MENQEQTTEPGRTEVADRFASIIVSAMDAIISVDQEQRIVLFNPAAERMFGVSEAHALGSYIDRFIPDRFRAAHPKQVQDFGETGATHRRMGRLGAVRGLRASGEEFPAEASISHMDTAKGTIYTVIMRDISERVAAEEALRRVRENLEKLVEERTARLRETITELESMSYSIIHDMRAPLRAIQSFAGILEEEAEAQLAPAHREYLKMMRAAAGRMDDLIRDVLAYNTIVRRDLPLKHIDTVPLLKYVIATYPSFQPPALTVEILPGIPPVCGNEALLTQCFSNLLSNVIKFAKNGEPAVVRVSGDQRGDSVRIAFQDRGMGIPAAMHDKIFGLFQRLSRSKEGTGMGLAIVRKAVERMGGSVSLESKEGQGSTFYLDLPSSSS